MGPQAFLPHGLHEIDFRVQSSIFELIMEAGQLGRACCNSYFSEGSDREGYTSPGHLVRSGLRGLSTSGIRGLPCEKFLNELVKCSVN